MKRLQTTRNIKPNFVAIIATLILFGLLGMVSISLAEEGKWTKKAGNQIPRFRASTSVVDEKIYLFGGVTQGPPNWIVTNQVEVYDPASDTWKKKTNMPRGGTNGLSSSVVDGIIYTIGGFPGWTTVDAYNPATNTWERKKDMPTQRMSFSTSVVDGIIYAIGGSRGDFNQWAGFTTVEAYNPVTNTWEEKAPMPTGKTLLSTSVVDGKIYAIGGSAGPWNGVALATVEVYDPATDTWERKKDMPTPRIGLSTSVVDGKIYAIGGTDNVWGPALSTVEAYHPETDVWEESTDMLTSRWALSTSVVDGKIYAIGGSPTGVQLFAAGIVEAFDTGFREKPSTVNPAGKLSTTWGEIKAAR